MLLEQELGGSEYQAEPNGGCYAQLTPPAHLLTGLGSKWLRMA